MFCCVCHPVKWECYRQIIRCFLFRPFPVPSILMWVHLVPVARFLLLRSNRWGFPPFESLCR